MVGWSVMLMENQTLISTLIEANASFWWEIWNHSGYYWCNWQTHIRLDSDIATQCLCEHIKCTLLFLWIVYDPFGCTNQYIPSIYRSIVHNITDWVSTWPCILCICVDMNKLLLVRSVTSLCVSLVLVVGHYIAGYNVIMWGRVVILWCMKVSNGISFLISVENIVFN